MAKIKQKAPGAIQKEFRERGDQDYRLDATLNLKEFTALIITLALHHNHKIIDKYPMANLKTYYMDHGEQLKNSGI